MICNFENIDQNRFFFSRSVIRSFPLKFTVKSRFPLMIMLPNRFFISTRKKKQQNKTKAKPNQRKQKPKHKTAHKDLEKLPLTFEPWVLSATNWVITANLVFLRFITLVDTHIPQRRAAEDRAKKGHLFCQKSKIHCAKVHWQSIIKNPEMTTHMYACKSITFGHLIPRDHSRQWQKGSRSAIIKSKWWWRPNAVLSGPKKKKPLQ